MAQLCTADWTVDFTHTPLSIARLGHPRARADSWQTTNSSTANEPRVRICANMSEHMRNRVKRAVGLHLLYSLKRADELRAGKITDICLKEKEKNCTVTTQPISTHAPRCTVLSVRCISVSIQTNKSAEKSN